VIKVVGAEARTCPGPQGVAFENPGQAYKISDARLASRRGIRLDEKKTGGSRLRNSNARPTVAPPGARSLNLMDKPHTYLEGLDQLLSVSHPLNGPRDTMC